MYNEFFGFHSTPFDIVPNPDYLYLSERHKIALDHLEYGLVSGASFILLTGEIGTGKTTLVREVLRRSIPLDTEVALIFQTNVSAEQLINMLLTEFELPTHPGDKPGALDEINQFLVSRYSQNRKVLIVVDEAQNLTPEALEELRMLSNLQSDERMLLQVILVGQPELKRKLLAPSLAQFAQRIAVNYHLTALTAEETGEYIAYRLVKAGGRPEIFSPEAVARIHEGSSGVPRSINLLCASSLLYAYADQSQVVTEEHVAQSVEDKSGLGGTARKAPWDQLEPVQQVAVQPVAELAAPVLAPMQVMSMQGIPVHMTAPAVPAQAVMAQAAETNQRLGAMEGDLRALLDAFGSYEEELTRRIESMRTDEQKATQVLADRCDRLERIVRRMAAPLAQQARKIPEGE